MIKLNVCIAILMVSLFALDQVIANYEPLPVHRGDEPIEFTNPIPYLGGRQCPGDSIGTTWYDKQENCGHGQRIKVDILNQAHINWIRMPDSLQNERFCGWNARYTDGSYYGQTQVSPSWSGYVQLDITRDTLPVNQRTVNAYHYDPGSGYYSYIDIDAGNLYGAWPHTPRTPQVPDHIWPYVCCANNGNIILATGDYNANSHHVYCTTDEGITWTLIATFDSCAVLSQFLQASILSGSNDVVFVHTQYITDTVASGQLDNDIWYMRSSDGGVTWGPYTNVTNYQPYPIDSVRAYCDVCAAYDDNDNLHIAWSGRQVTDNYYEASKIYYWNEIIDTITVVSSPSIYYNEPGGWWISQSYVSGWRMPADRPQLVVDRASDWIYCLWQGNDDYTDCSDDGFFNQEIFGSYSTDNGLTWSNYRNLTNTRSPGGVAGECLSEDYMTAHPYVVNDSIYITYEEDIDAGTWTDSEGIMTHNPVRCWVFPTSLITGIDEHHNMEPSAISLRVAPNPFVKQTSISLSRGQSAESMELKIYDASGRVVKSFPHLTPDALRATLQWNGTDQHGESLPAGVYFITLTSKDKSATKKIVKLK